MLNSAVITEEQDKSVWCDGDNFHSKKLLLYDFVSGEVFCSYGCDLLIWV